MCQPSGILRPVSLLLLLAAGGCAPGGPGPDGESPASGPTVLPVEIEQDGRRVPLADGQARLRPGPFAIILTFAEPGGVLVHASRDPRLYRAVRSGQPAASVLPLSHQQAEDDLLNPARSLTVDPGAYRYWHYFGPENHRFDRVEVSGAGLRCRRTVRRLLGAGGEGARTASMSGEELYITFVRTAWTGTPRRRVERDARAIRLIFADS